MFVKLPASSVRQEQVHEETDAADIPPQKSNVVKIDKRGVKMLTCHYGIPKVLLPVLLHPINSTSSVTDGVVK